MTGTAIPVEYMDARVPILIFTAPNAGPKTLEGTHTYLVGSKGAYVIDPGPDNVPYQYQLADYIDRRGYRVSGILLTHGHPDHAPGALLLAELLAVPVLAGINMPDTEARNAGVTRTFRPGARFEVDEDILEVIGTPGHTPDHVAFWLRGERVLFCGDTILGRGTTLIAPPEGNMQAYMRTLNELARLAPRLIAPGHGPMVTDPARTIEMYIRHRTAREQQVLEALRAGSATAQELVHRIYTNVDPAVLDLAHASVLAQLEKLVEEGEVTVEGGCYARSAPT